MDNKVRLGKVYIQSYFIYLPQKVHSYEKIRSFRLFHNNKKIIKIC